MVTLGDGITKDEWSWINRRAEIAFGPLPKKVLTATLVWSDNAHYSLLDEYIKTRRPSLHKQMYELKNRNASIGSVARTEHLEALEGAIFVPNFDLCSKDEQNAILSYNKGTVICTAPAKYVKENKIKYDLYFEDIYAPYKMCVFAFNLTANINELTQNVNNFFKEKETLTEPDGAPMLWEDQRFFKQQMPFRTMSDAFLNSCAYILNNAHGGIFRSEANILPVLLSNGKYRIHVFNYENLYQKYKITSKQGVAGIEIVSNYPVMPPRFVYKPKPGTTKFDGAKAESMTIGMETGEIPFEFIAKVPPHGVSVFDVELHR